MTLDMWDADQAVVVTPDTDREPTVSAATRYGITDREASLGEPLNVILAQEQPDVAVEPADVEDDDEWLLVDDDDAFAGRLVASTETADDNAEAVDDPAEFSAEELAMHVVYR